jgi:hypothetical protein
MKKLFLIPLLILTIQVSAQDFCGHIKYRYTYFKTKNNKDVTARSKEVKTEDFYICGNKFKVYFDGKLNDMYIGDSVVYFHIYTDSIRYVKADSTYGQDAPKYYNRNESAMYEDKSYKSIEVNSNDQHLTYYYNGDIRIDPSKFERLALYHWNSFFIATNGGLRLVSVDKGKKLTSICEAIEINRIDLSDKDFALPSGIEIKPFDFFKVLN